MANAATIESANATHVVLCHHCDELGHLAKDCPYANQFRQLIMHIKTNKGGGHGKGKGRGSANATSSNTQANSSSTPTQPAQQETAGVSSSFPIPSRSADCWLLDTGATCSMSHNRRDFTSICPDRRPIRLADGKAVYSEGIGSIRF